MKRLYRGLAVCAAITLATLATLELSLRAYDVVTGDIVFDELIKNSSRRDLRPHPFLQYTSSRNFHGLVSHLEPGLKFWTTTNSSGFRTHELYPKPPGRVRVLLLGDSFMHGANAHDHETTQAVLEARLRRDVSADVDVISLGVPSYSGVRYAVLARMYFESLRPDVVVVAVDSSDYEEDVSRIGEYLLDSPGYPLILRAYRSLEDSTTPQEVNFTRDRTMVIGGTSVGQLLALRAGSSLVNHLWLLADQLVLNRLPSSALNPADFAVVTPDQFSRDYCEGPPTVPWPYCFDPPAMVARYEPTRKSLEYVKRKADDVGAKLYFSSYPYPWFAQIDRALANQAAGFGFKQQLDFRADRRYPQLLARFAADLGVDHLDAYPTFGDSAVNYWGNVDPHFNAVGYRHFAEFLFEAIKDEVRRRLPPSQPGS